MNLEDRASNFKTRDQTQNFKYSMMTLELDSIIAPDAAGAEANDRFHPICNISLEGTLTILGSWITWYVDGK